MADLNRNKNILEFVNKSCSLFDTYIEFNKDLVSQIQKLRQFGQSLIHDITAESNLSNNNSIISSELVDTNKIIPITTSNGNTTFNDQAETSNQPETIYNNSNNNNNNHDHNSLSEEEGTSEMNLSNEMDIEPSSTSLLESKIVNDSNHVNKLNKNDELLKNLLQIIELNPLTDVSALNDDDDDSIKEDLVTTKKTPAKEKIKNGSIRNSIISTSISSSSFVKNCQVVIEKLEIDSNLQNQMNKLIESNRRHIDEADKEDAEINRLCSLDNLIKSPKKTSTVNNHKLKEKETKQAETKIEEDDDGDDDDEADTAPELNDDLMLSIGLVNKKILNPIDLNETVKSNDESDDEEEEEVVSETNGLKKKKNSEKSKKKEVFMSDLLVPNFSESDDDDKDNDSKSSKDEKEKFTRKKRETNNDKSNSNNEEIEEESESISNDAEASSKSSEKSESNKNTTQNVDTNNEDEEEEESIIKTSKKSKRNLLSLLSSDENDSTNDQVASVKKKADSSESDATTSKSSENSKKTKKRRRIKNLDENESDLNDSDNSTSQTSKQSRNKKSKKKVKKNSESSSSDSGSDSSVVELDKNEDLDSSQATRHKLRNIKDDEKLAKETQDALNAEKERKKRLEEKRKLETTIVKENDVYLNIDEETQEKSIKVDDVIAAILKPHQIEGVKFMWDCCFESVKMIADPKNEGSGCLLAHCMGLGKTLQVIALSHTVFAHRTLTKCNRILILMPVNVQLNWKAEFVQWTEKCKNKVQVYDLPSNKLSAKEMLKKRLDTLEKWFQKGGIFLMGYEIFSRLVHGKDIKQKKQQERFTEYLINPGPDLIVCDEGHLLKNATSQMAIAVNQIKTKRRIVLTGTPLQNNLIEYHCMVSFVKPNLLGTAKEFRNRFVNPITNGQCKDSTDGDVRLMKKRAHVLHNSLEGCVNRKDFSVMRNFLPPKNEYVLSIRLSEKQITLYRNYLVKQRGIESINSLGKVHGTQLFNDFQMLARIWTHPWILKLNDDRVQKIELKNEIKMAEKDFVVDDDDDDDIDDEVICDDNDDDEKESKTSTLSDDDCIMETDNNNEATTSKKVTRQSKYKTRNSKVAINGGGINDTESNSNDSSPKSPPEWWSDLVTPECEFDINLSGKLVILTKILSICREKEDKLVLFSQSIQSLNIIEKFLEHLTKDKKDHWVKNTDYFRLDGQVEIAKRKNCIKQFNDPKNKVGRLFIISTKAGGIGINLIGANRCIVFDASWNPSFDTQSIFRIYRLGQSKEVFIYRFLGQGTMEEKIYQRQVNKQSLAQRVIDEHQLDRHFTSSELKELYAFEPDTGESATFNMPNDDLLKRLLHEEKKWIVRYHDHESLLENKLDEGLSEDDRKAAWLEYEAERTNPYANAYNNMNNYQINPDEMNPYLLNVINGNLSNLTPAQQLLAQQQQQQQQQLLLHQQHRQMEFQRQLEIQRHQQFLLQSQNRNFTNNITPVLNANTRPIQNGTNYNNSNLIKSNSTNSGNGSFNAKVLPSSSSSGMQYQQNNQQYQQKPYPVQQARMAPVAQSTQNILQSRNPELSIDYQNYLNAKSSTERSNYLNIIKRNDPLSYQRIVTESRNNVLRNANQQPPRN